MEIVIKIDEKDYNLVYDLISGVEPKFCRDRIYKAIANGTVLSKGHGRLIEANHFNIGCGIRAIDCLGKCEKCSDCVVKYEDICNAKTVVDADNG